jgi:hypothetical protein
VRAGSGGVLGGIIAPSAEDEKPPQFVDRRLVDFYSADV